MKFQLSVFEFCLHLTQYTVCVKIHAGTNNTHAMRHVRPSEEQQLIINYSCLLPVKIFHHTSLSIALRTVGNIGIM
jgi:hypothetical protein